jgi:hypothetical protein
MKILTHILALIAGILIVLYPVSRKIALLNRDCMEKDLVHTARILENRLNASTIRLSAQLAAFGNTISKDYDFSMKLLVEKNPTAPEVYEMAARYMEAMGLSVLDLIDEKKNVVSSGHFPARAGNPAGDKLMLLAKKGMFITDNIKGNEVFTFQAKASFACSDVPLYAVGGFIIDSAFLSDLTPRKEMALLLKRGNAVIGRNDIKSMSAITDNIIIINDCRWLAATIPLSVPKGDPSAELLLLAPEPSKLSLTALFF